MAGNPYRVKEHVRWSDVDASGIIRWSAYTRFVELAETELFRAIGFPYANLWERLDIWLPRVQFHLDCRTPARLDDLLAVDIGVERIGSSSIRFAFSMSKPEDGLAAEGYLVVVAIRRDTGKSTEVPRELVEALNPYTVIRPSPLHP